MNETKSQQIVAQLKELTENEVIKWHVDPQGQYFVSGELVVSCRDGHVSSIAEKNKSTRISEQDIELLTLIRRKVEEQRALRKAQKDAEKNVEENKAQDAILAQLADITASLT
ncbi:MAG: hypothetical protein NTX81_01660 [Candidatus Bathyarchaeota archaeon]|nr:hypothetical protein [Candidatus Bathyarchaeota archaeon]